MNTALSVRKLTAADVKSVDVENGTVTAVVSDESVDRDGDIIRVTGWQLDAFRALPIMLADHDYSIEKAIGRWGDMKIEGTQLIGTAEYFLNSGNELAERAFALAQRGLAAFSVGFKTYPEHTIRLDSGGNEYRKQELLEVSQVAIPSNPHALAFVKRISKDWDEEMVEVNESYKPLESRIYDDIEVVKELIVSQSDATKDLAEETVRLHAVMNMLMEAVVQIKEHMDYMYQPAANGGGLDDDIDEEKPKPKPPQYRLTDHETDQLILSALSRNKE